METNSPEELEVLVLSSLRTIEHIRAAVEAGLAEDSWQIEENANAWEYIQDRVKTKGSLPTHADVKAACGVELLPDITDDVSFLEELIDRTIQRRAQNIIIKYAPDLRLKPKEAVSGMIGDLSEIAKNTTSHSRYFDADVLQRLERIKERSEQSSSGRIVGIRTGLHALDSVGSNWHPGDIVCIQGPLSVGKSMLLLWFCAYAYVMDQKKVLFLTPESTIEDIEDRLDPMVSRFMDYKISNRALRSGTVDMIEYEHYLKSLENTNRRDWITRDSGTSGFLSLDDIVQQAREHRPDVVAIDGVHLIGGKGDSWERMQDAGTVLKGLAQSMGLVVIGGTQVDRSAVMAADEPASLGQYAYGKAFLESANKVISLADKRGDKKQKVWKLVKNRDGEKIETKQYLRFDVDTGHIGDMSINIDDSSGLVSFDEQEIGF